MNLLSAPYVSLLLSLCRRRLRRRRLRRLRPRRRRRCRRLSSQRSSSGIHGARTRR